MSDSAVGKPPVAVVGVRVVVESVLRWRMHAPVTQAVHLFLSHTLLSNKTNKQSIRTGMMDPAYFTSKKELLEFFNDLLDLNLTKIEDTAPGAIACQLTSLIFPNSIPLGRVNWGARSEYEYVQNYKLLQAAFTKHNVRRHVDVNKLIRGKYQDNLEFAQWFKAFYEQSGVIPAPDYNPRAVRERGKGGKLYNQTMSRSSGSNKPRLPRAGVPPSSSTTTTTKPTNSSISAAVGEAERRPSRPLRARVVTNTPPVLNTTTAATTNAPVVVEEKPDPTTTVKPPPPSNTAEHMQLVAENKELQNQVQELTSEAELLDGKNSALTAQVEELELAVLETENERNYYFEKLRHIEVLLQVFQERDTTTTTGEDATTTDKLVEDVFQILYATQQDNLVVNEDGQVVVADAEVDDEEGSMDRLGKEDSMDNDMDELLSDNV